MILPAEKTTLQCGPSHFSSKKRHHCVSFCDDITVVEFECDKCPLSVNKPPICVSRNLKNSLFLPQQVSKFFDRYLPYENERKNLMTLAKKKSGIKYVPCNSDSLKLKDLFTQSLNTRTIFNQCAPTTDTRDEFLSMTSKEKQWLASVQIHQLNEILSSDYYFKKYMAKNNPGVHIIDPSDFLKEIKLINAKKQVECVSPDVTHCLGKIPMFTVAHARRVLEESLLSDSAVIRKCEPNVLLTIEYYYDLLLQIQHEVDPEQRDFLVKTFAAALLRVDDVPKFMNIGKGQTLYFKLYDLLDNHFLFWKTIFQSLPQFFKLNKSSRPLNAFLSLFKAWLMSNSDLAHVNVLATSIETILSFLLADKFGISIISLLVICSTNVKVILNSDEADRQQWAMFLNKLIQSIDHHPHVENPLVGSRKHLVQFLNAIAPTNVHLRYY